MTTGLEPSVGQQFLFLLYFQTIYSDPSLGKEGVRIVPSYKGHLLDSCTLGETFEFGHCCTVFCRKKDGHADFFLDRRCAYAVCTLWFPYRLSFPNCTKERGLLFVYSWAREERENALWWAVHSIVSRTESVQQGYGVCWMAGGGRGLQRQLSLYLYFLTFLKSLGFN